MSSQPQLVDMVLTVRPSGVAVLEFNKPTRGNSLTHQTYKDWLAATLYATISPDVRVLLLTGRGPFFSSGKDLDHAISTGNKPRAPTVDPASEFQTYIDLVDAMIDFPKPLIAGVNGPAIGQSCTALGLCDLVYSVPNAYFLTPFARWAFTAEGCSSYTFPKIMGHQKAAAMLIGNKRVPASDMLAYGFVNEIFPLDGFAEKVLAEAERIASYGPKGIVMSLQLVKGGEERERLKKVHKDECYALLNGGGGGEESTAAIKQFLEQEAKRKSKSKI